MKFDLADMVRELELRLDGDIQTALKRAIEEMQYSDLAKEAEVALASPRSHKTDIAVLRVLARAAAHDTSALDRVTAEGAAEWLARDEFAASFRKPFYFGALVGKVNPGDLEAILDAALRFTADPTSHVFSLSSVLAIDVREQLLERLARHPRSEIREHFFALLGKHKRLVPPGTIQVYDVSKERLLKLLSIGISDANPRVRVRAIAAAYGIGVIDGLRDEVVARVSDEDGDVRQYAIVAIGVLADGESRRLLRDRLHHGSQNEATSAIWALARRPDGIADVLALADDEREWVRQELLGAFAEVAAPLSDDQISRLAEKVQIPEWPQLRQRHLDRTRHGAPEQGPDGRIEYVLRKD